jgi:hypothetical protein
VAYRDSSEQRERARRATQVFQDHAQRFHGRPPESEHRWARNEWQTPEEQAPAMSFVVPDPDTGASQIVQRAPSALKRAARFRDGLPPPPLPQPESAYPQYTPPPRAQLLDQALVDQGITQPFRPKPTLQQATSALRAQATEHGVFNTGTDARMIERVQFAQPVQYRQSSSPGPHPLIPDDLVAQASQPPLSPSQKKRLRRQKAAAAKRGAPFPLPQDQPLTATPQQTKPRQNGVHPTPGLENAPRVCGDEELAETRPGGPIIRLRCGITQPPHTGQAHIMKLEAANGSQTDSPGDVPAGFRVFTPAPHTENRAVSSTENCSRVGSEASG